MEQKYDKNEYDNVAEPRRTFKNRAISLQLYKLTAFNSAGCGQLTGSRRSAEIIALKSAISKIKGWL